MTIHSWDGDRYYERESCVLFMQKESKRLIGVLSRREKSGLVLHDEGLYAPALYHVYFIHLAISV